MKFFISKFNNSRLFFLIACIVCFFSAYHSIGFYHADEHYQILEFANMKLGNSPPNELPWEYSAQIRPVAQVTFAMLTITFLKYLSIVSPYTQVFVLRCLTAILMLLIVFYFIRKTRHFFSNSNTEKFYIISSYFLWFIPFLSVRFSSEIWSGLFFLLLISLYLEKDTRIKNSFLIGIVAGFSFLFRFQIAFALVGFFSWLIFIKKELAGFYLKFLAAFILVLSIGFFLDTWFYDELTYTPINYIAKFISSNQVQSYGVSPWYFYFEKIITFPSLVIGIPLFLSLLIFFIKNPKNMFSWILISFLFFHSIIDHKEVRFMFPMIYFLPFIFSLMYSKYIYDRKPKITIKIGLVFFFLFNFLLIFLMGSKGTGRGRLVIAKYIYDYYHEKEVDLFYTNGGYLFEDPKGSLKMNFYNQKNLNLTEVSSFCNIPSNEIKSHREKLLVIQYSDLKLNTCLKMENIIFLKESLPMRKEWLLRLNSLGIEIPKLDKMLLLYKIN